MTNQKRIMKKRIRFPKNMVSLLKEMTKEERLRFFYRLCIETKRRHQLQITA